MYIDTSQLRAFAMELEAKSADTTKQVRSVIEKGANNIKKQLRSEMGASGSFGHLARGITYDITAGGDLGGTVVEAEIGMVKKFTGEKKAPRRGANIAYFGTSKGGGSVADPRGALDAEIPAVEKWLLDVAGDL